MTNRERSSSLGGGAFKIVRKQQGWTGSIYHDVVPKSPDKPYEPVAGWRRHKEDGVWLCCKGHADNENLVTHRQGAFPFNRLECTRCDHIFCPECSSSAVLKRVHSSHLNAFQEPSSATAGLVPYCRLCRTCGRTQRGVVKKGRLEFAISCPCGKATVYDDERIDFFIGSNEKYQEDKEGVTVQLRIDHRLGAHQRVKRERRVEFDEKTSRGPVQPPKVAVSKETRKATDQAMDAGPRQSTRKYVPKRSRGRPQLTVNTKEWHKHQPWPEDTRFKTLPESGFVLDADFEHSGLSPSSIACNSETSLLR